MNEKHCSPCKNKALPLIIVGLAVSLMAIGTMSGKAHTVGAASGTYVGQTVATPRKSVQIARFNLPSASAAAQGTSIAQVNTDPVLNLVDALKARGAQVSVAESELKGGITVLNVTVNGKPITPWVKECPTCAKIVFEY